MNFENWLIFSKDVDRILVAHCLWTMVCKLAYLTVVFFQVKKDEVGLYLHKAHPGSWAAQLSSGTGGIETAPHS